MKYSHRWLQRAGVIESFIWRLALQRRDDR